MVFDVYSVSFCHVSMITLKIDECSLSYVEFDCLYEYTEQKQQKM